LYDLAPATAVQLTVTEASPPLALSPAGAAGTTTGTAGVTPGDWVEAGPSPAALSAVTW